MGDHPCGDSKIGWDCQRPDPTKKKKKNKRKLKPEVQARESWEERLLGGKKKSVHWASGGLAKGAKSATEGEGSFERRAQGSGKTQDPVCKNYGKNTYQPQLND